MNVLAKPFKRLFTQDSKHYAIAKGMLTIALFVFFGKLAGAAKEMVVAYRYGVSEEVDAYLFLYNLVNWPVSVWFSVLTYVLVPLAVRVRRENPVGLPRFRAELLGLTLVLGVDLTLIAWLGLPSLLQAQWVGLSASSLTIIHTIFVEMISLLPLGLLVGLFSAWLLASERHMNTLLESVPALVILVTVLTFSNAGIKPLVYGTFIGFIVHVLCLWLPLVLKGDVNPPRFSQKSPEWSAFWKGFGVLMVGNSIMSFVGVIDQFFAAQLGGGVIATLSYANRVLTLIIGLGATAISRATLPIFSKTSAEDSMQTYQVAMFWVKIMFALGVVAMFVCWLLAPWAIKVLFERGQFTPKDTQAVTEVFRYGLIQLPFYFSVLIMVALLASRRHHKIIALNASVNLLTKVGANYLLVPKMGVNGIITATGVMYMCAFMLFYWFSKTTNTSFKVPQN